MYEGEALLPPCAGQAGLAPLQETVGEREAATRRFREFHSIYIPGLLQTPGYARTRIKQTARVWGVWAPRNLAERDLAERDHVGTPAG